MFLRRRMLLLDPEEAQRRKRLRARIIRRNRIKKEIEQGLEPGLHRKGYEPNAKYRGGNDDDSAFTPTFGGNSDHEHVRAKDRYVAGTLRTSYRPTMREDSASNRLKPEQRKQKPVDPSTDHVDSSTVEERASDEFTITPQPQLIHEAASASHSSSPANLLLGSHHHAATGHRVALPPPVIKPPPVISKAKIRWHEAFHQVVFRRHEEVLSKDPNRKWRQERFGLLLFDKKQYERAAKHLTLAITLGANSSTCWRRLAQSHFYTWEAKNDWDTLWDSKAVYEQAMNHLEIACNPFALFEYAKVLEVLGIYTGALGVCASILQTFPRFQLLHRVMLRFVMLQRYQIFSTTGGSLDNSEGASTLGTMQAIERESMLLKCVGYTKALLLDKQIVEGELYVCVLYMHARLNELLAVSTTSAARSQVAARVAQESSDHSFEELFKVAIARRLVAPTTSLTWKTWKAKSDSYISLAGAFHDLNEPIAAADALSRALDMLEVPLVRSSTDTRVDTLAQSRSKLALYLALGRNYYQCNQMEKAIRSMEAVFQMNHYHEEARASLSAWFPAKWKYRLELEDASQIQIARVIRGIWGRNRGLRRRHEVVKALETKYRENPYHPLHRRNVLRVLKVKYAPLFMAQDISARRIQARARRFLYYARIRWSLEDQHNKFLQQLTSKQQTRKYRYNRHVRKQLAQLQPEQFEDRFRQEDRAALYIQRHFRGERTRRAFRVRRDAHRSRLKRESDAAFCIQRCYRHHSSSGKLSPDELLYRAQLRISQARERVARNLQLLYRRHWKANRPQSLASSLFKASQQNIERKTLYRHTSATRIQRAWHQHVARSELGSHGHDSAKVLLHQLRRGHERLQTTVVVVTNEDDLERAARKIQALYRGKRIRRSLCKIRRVRAPVSASPIAALIGLCKSNHKDGLESCVTLHGARTLEEKRALFDYPVVVLDPVGSSLASGNSVEVQYIVSAIEHNARLRCLVCASGEFQSDNSIRSLLSSLKISRSLRVLALGSIHTTSNYLASDHHAVQSQTPEQDDELDDLPPNSTSSSPPLPLRSSSNHQSLEPPGQSPMQALSVVLRTANFVLEELVMENNTLLRDPDDGACVAAFLGDFFFARYGRLRKLVLTKMHFSDANAALLGPALAINTVLQHLDLHGNLISDAGATLIATSGLSCNQSLIYLSLAENAVGSVGAKALFECLAHQNRTLETLVLCNNNVLNDAIPAFTAAWQLNATILLIDLRGNLIHSDHLHTLHRATEERRMSSSAEPELRLFLARMRYSTASTALGQSMTTLSSQGARSPLKSISAIGSRKGTRAAKSALSPTAFLRQAKQNDAATSTTTAAFIRSPLAVYKQQQHEDDTDGSKRLSPAASASVLALVSPVRIAASSKKKPARAATKLPAINQHRRRAAW